jgi:hypothetical protein
MSVTNAREFLYIVRESALNTPKASPVLGTDALYLRLPDGNAFKMYAKPVFEKIPYGGGFAVTAEMITDHYAVEGSLTTKFYPTDAQLLLDWATTRINTAQTSPWTTTELPGDLASCTIYHAVRRSDGSYNRKQFSGVKVKGCTIEVSRDATIATISLDLIGSKQTDLGSDSADPSAMTFAAPAETNYPTAPYTFAMTAGQVSIGGTTRTQYSDLSIKINNAIDSQWFETAYRQVLQFLGRDSTLDATLFYKPMPDDRSAFEAGTAQALSVGFSSGVTGQNLTINFNGQNTITDLPFDLPLDKLYTLKMSLQNRFDASAPGDFAFGLA